MQDNKASEPKMFTGCRRIINKNINDEQEEKRIIRRAVDSD